jgi:hypothetical protein
VGGRVSERCGGRHVQRLEQIRKPGGRKLGGSWVWEHLGGLGTWLCRLVRPGYRASPVTASSDDEKTDSGSATSSSGDIVWMKQNGASNE